MSIPLYGIWLAAYGKWLLQDTGLRFQTIEIDQALDAYNELHRRGVLDIEVREIMQLPQGRDRDESGVKL